MKLVPLEDRVVVKVLEQEEKTASGIVLPDTAKEKPSKGNGHGRRSRQVSTTTASCMPMPVKVGDIVVFAKYAGTELKLDGEEYSGAARDRHHRHSAQRLALEGLVVTHDHDV